MLKKKISPVSENITRTFLISLTNFFTCFGLGLSVSLMTNILSSLKNTVVQFSVHTTKVSLAV